MPLDAPAVSRDFRDDCLDDLADTLDALHMMTVRAVNAEADAQIYREMAHACMPKLFELTTALDRAVQQRDALREQCRLLLERLGERNISGQRRSVR
jgi:hypothetical protein